MEGNDVFDMEDTQYDDQPALEPETTHQTGGIEINTPTVIVDIPVPELKPTPIVENPSIDDETRHYNPVPSDIPDDEAELGLADCWPLCKALTGSNSNNADYGFHA